MTVDSLLWAPRELQMTFRSLMNAFSYPGTIHEVNQNSTETATEQVLACLADNQTSLACLHERSPEEFFSLLEVRITNPEDADFVIGDGAKFVNGWQPKLGTLENPHLSATLLLEVKSLRGGQPFFSLKGPGIKEENKLQLEGLDPQWFVLRNQWCGAFPMGVDIILCSPVDFCVIPRTTIIDKG